MFKELPSHLGAMALFAVNTGCRDQEVCKLCWEWEVQVPELKTSVFIIPGRHVKNGDERLIVLNRIAKSVVDAQRGKHSARVFTYQGKPTTRMLNKAWLAQELLQPYRRLGFMISSTHSDVVCVGRCVV